MDIDARHSLLREKLNSLGFTQPLPFGSLAIVSALLDDLILTNKNLKCAKKTISELEKEKVAWNLGVEPYKCDNSKLLAECNSLHLDMIRQQDAHQQRIFDLNKNIRNLEYENRELKRHCDELDAKIDELDPKHRKHRNDLLNEKRKPFISTVRSGEFLPSRLKSIENMSTKSKCSCQSETNDTFARLYAEQEANKVKTQLELIELFKSQIESRNREISRLNQLLSGGRPIPALAKDCCYRDISSLAEDLKQLQRQKSQCEANYEQEVQRHRNTLEEMEHLKNENGNLKKELASVKDLALSVETEANQSLEAMHKRNTALKSKLNELKKRIQELESNCGPSDEFGVNDLKTANAQIKFLQDQLKNASNRECELKTEVERLIKKNAKLKGKLSTDNACRCNNLKRRDSKDASSMTSTDMDFSDCSIDVNRLKIDRDYYQQEYLKLLQKPPCDAGELNLLRKQLMEKDYEIKSLMRKLESCRSGYEEPNSCRAIEAAMNRLEREKKVLQDTVNRLTVECDELRESLHLANVTQRNQIDRDECEMEQLKQKIRQLENENVSLKSIEANVKSTVNILKEEICQLKEEITRLKEENLNLRTTNKQLRVLQEQTENTLIQHQSRLTHCERERDMAEARLNAMDSNRSDGHREIGELRAEISRLKAMNIKLTSEKDKLISDLDAKTEELFQLEPKLEKMKTRVIELESELAALRRQMSLDNLNRNSSSQHTINEMEELRKQVKQLKTTNDNLLFENRRLLNNLAEAECDNQTIKTKLVDADKEIDRLKRQLQQYVQEVQRAEDLLHHKEEERNEMLEQYRTLSHDAVALEGTNQSLELEAAESKRNLMESAEKLARLQTQLADRERELDGCNTRVCELTKRNNQVELDIQRYKHERDALRKELNGQKELCAKLDIEIEKLHAEVHEYSEIRQDLENEIERLRDEISLLKVGDNATTDGLRQLLCDARKELDEERIVSRNLKKEIKRLSSKIEELQANFSEEHANAVRHKTLAKEYHSQIQELRDKLTDTRFDRACSKPRQSGDRFSSF